VEEGSAATGVTSTTGATGATGATGDDHAAAPRWSVVEVLALAPDAAVAGAARRVAVPAEWSGLGCDAGAVWGLFHGSGAEPYQVGVDLTGPVALCTCPSRKRPCKHAVALLLLWSAEHVATGGHAPAPLGTWLVARARRDPAAPPEAAREADPEPPEPALTPTRRRTGRRADDTHGPAPGPPGPGDQRAAERAARVAAGLLELDRWLADSVRGGLTAPALADRAAWELVAARLVDAQAGSLANRVLRVAELVGASVAWHEQVLAELGVLHLLAEAGRRLPSLPDDLADAVRQALGFTVRQATVLDTPPETDRWIVAGRSDTLEDRIVVRRLWLRGAETRAWALVLSFAAWGQSLPDRVAPGAVMHGDLHRYPGRRELRCLVGRVLDPPALLSPPVAPGAPSQAPGVPPAATSLAGACDEVGAALAEVPWLERWPVVVYAAPTLVRGRWVLTDHTGSLPLTGPPSLVPTLVAVSGGAPVRITAEWTAGGLVPLAVFGPDGVGVDVGPRGGFDDRRRGVRA
jgi:hypothetical protein